jgi:hypothetical protein
VYCIDAWDDPVCAGNSGYIPCPNPPECVKACDCSSSGNWINCQAGCYCP